MIFGFFESFIYMLIDLISYLTGKNTWQQVVSAKDNPFSTTKRVKV